MTTLTMPLTADEVLAMPENPRVIRELYRGILEERKMTKRSFSHGRTQMAVGKVLSNWLDTQSPPRGAIIGGEAAIRIATDPDTFVGVDVALILAALAKATPRDAKFVDGIPDLIVEILSPSDRHNLVVKKVSEYIRAGVPMTWVMDPDLELLTVIEPGLPPRAFNVTQNFPPHPLMPGFAPSIKDLFE